MANYDDLKKKAKDAIGTIADVSVEAYKLAEEKARILAKRARLNTEITREKALIRRMKSEIGNKYYALHKDDPEEAFKEFCESVTDSMARIETKRRELEELKSGGASCDCDAESASGQENEEGKSDSADECGDDCDCHSGDGGDQQ